MPPKQYLHEETEPHMGMELVCTSAGENFSFNRFHCTKTGNATFLRAICWDVKGGLSCRTGPSKGTAIHHHAIIQGTGFLYDTLFFILFLTMTGFVFDARVWQRLGVGSEDTCWQTGILMTQEAWGCACLWLKGEREGWSRAKPRAEERQGDGEQVGVSLPGAGPT